MPKTPYDAEPQADGAIIEVPGRGIVFAAVDSVPSSVAGYAPGCQLVDMTGAQGYTNTGTLASCTFTANT